MNLLKDTQQPGPGKQVGLIVDVFHFFSGGRNNLIFELNLTEQSPRAFSLCLSVCLHSNTLKPRGKGKRGNSSK